MTINDDKTKLGDKIKVLMGERAMSMRKLSKLTGINTASLSRIINGKQPPNLNHIIKLSKHLDMSILELLKTLGIDERQVLDEGRYCLIKIINDSVSPFCIDIQSIVADIKNELKKYERYAKTEEGKKIIEEKGMAKINEGEGSGEIIKTIKNMYRLYCLDQVSEEDKVIIGGALLYFILKTDIIPDNLFPVGYLDDAIAVTLAAQRIPDCLNPPVLSGGD